MVKISWKSLILMDDFGGNYHYFWKHPYVFMAYFWLLGPQTTCMTGNRSHFIIETRRMCECKWHIFWTCWNVSFCITSSDFKQKAFAMKKDIDLDALIASRDTL